MSFLDYIKQDKIMAGAVAVLLSEVVPAVLLLAVLLLIDVPPMEHYSWFAGAALPGILVVRWYAKRKECLDATKGAISAFFLTFVVYMVIRSMAAEVVL